MITRSGTDLVVAHAPFAEKFLLDSSGSPVKRYSRYYPMLDIAADIDELI